MTARKSLALVLSLLMVLACLSGMTFASAEETVDKFAPVNVEDHQLFVGDQGGPVGAFGPGTNFGAKFTVPEGKRVSQIKIQHLATYTNNVNEIEIKVYQWNSDYGTSVTGKALATYKVVNHTDNFDFVFDLPNEISVEGDVVFEVTYLSGGAQMTPWFASGGGVDGVSYYSNGSECNAYCFHIQTSDALPDMKMYAEIDFTKYIEDPATYYGFTAQNQVDSVSAVCDQGYITLTSNGTDPYFRIDGEPWLSQMSAVTTDKMDYMLIKYRSTAATAAEFYVGRTDGVGWASPMDKSHVSYEMKATGNWETVIVDASGVWGNVEGVHLKDFRFDFTNSVDTVDVAYIRFYSTLEGAEAAATAELETVTETVTVSSDDAALHQGDDGKWYYGENNIPVTEAEGVFTYEKETKAVKAPEIPFNPANMDLKYMIDGPMLNTTSEANACEAAFYSYDAGFITYTATGDDPSFYMAAGVEVGPYMVIKYRTDSGIGSSEMFIGKSEAAQGPTDNVTWSIISDDQWHYAVVNVGRVQDYDHETNVANHIRFDFLNGAPVNPGNQLDVEFIAFFGDEASARYYADNELHTLPEAPKYKVTFMADGTEVAVVEFTEGDSSLSSVPDVPAKEGYTGEWESYKLGSADITVNAVYTEIPKETDPGEETTDPVEDPTEEITDEVTDPVEKPTEEVTEAPTEGTDETEPEKKGCGSVVGFGAVVILTAAAAFVALKKKEN